VLPFGWMVRDYFFFAAFFAAFFAGAFLAAFFVAICLFSLIRWFASILQNNIAVEECIDSCSNSVKRKTTHRWKKWQQFFIVESSTAFEFQIM
jgi:hypothetical protein